MSRNKINHMGVCGSSKKKTTMNNIIQYTVELHSKTVFGGVFSFHELDLD